MEKIKDYFERYPNSNECFEAGGRLFHTHGAAISFGSDVKKWTRADVKKETRDDNKVDFVDADLSSLTQKDLKKYADEFGLKTENDKREILLSALTEYQKQLNDGKDEDENEDDK
ncbi:MAG: hypothetical protein LBK94_08615 [Prevotellaceae bacterium]|jgi:hypothetical protein|nr:hypothetical protein [Prevotellaceae bacterium]